MNATLEALEVETCDVCGVELAGATCRECERQERVRDAILDAEGELEEAEGTVELIDEELEALLARVAELRADRKAPAARAERLRKRIERLEASL